MIEPVERASRAQRAAPVRAGDERPPVEEVAQIDPPRRFHEHHRRGNQQRRIGARVLGRVGRDLRLGHVPGLLDEPPEVGVGHRPAIEPEPFDARRMGGRLLAVVPVRPHGEVAARDPLHAQPAGPIDGRLGRQRLHRHLLSPRRWDLARRACQPPNQAQDCGASIRASPYGRAETGMRQPTTPIAVADAHLPGRAVQPGGEMRTRTHLVAMTVAAGLALGTGGWSRPAEAKPAAKPAIDPDAITALHKMGAFLREQQKFSVRSSVTTDDLLASGQKVQFEGTVEMMVRRPDRLRMNVRGDRRDEKIFYDGKTFTIFGERLGYYASFAAPGDAGRAEGRHRENATGSICRWPTSSTGGRSTTGPATSPPPPRSGSPPSTGPPATTTPSARRTSTGSSGSSRGRTRCRARWSSPRPRRSRGRSTGWS